MLTNYIFREAAKIIFYIGGNRKKKFNKSIAEPNFVQLHI